MQVGWPEAKWGVLQAAVSAWQEVAQMTDAQLGWQMVEEFPLSDEAVRLGAETLRLNLCAMYDLRASSEWATFLAVTFIIMSQRHTST